MRPVKTRHAVWSPRSPFFCGVARMSFIGNTHKKKAFWLPDVSRKKQKKKKKVFGFATFSRKQGEGCFDTAHLAPIRMRDTSVTYECIQHHKSFILAGRHTYTHTHTGWKRAHLREKSCRCAATEYPYLNNCFVLFFLHSHCGWIAAFSSL